MGTSHSAAEFAGKMNKIATTLPRATKAGIRDSSLAGKTLIQTVAASRGVSVNSRIAGRPWRAGYDLKGTPSHPASLLRITGAFPLVENDTPAHLIQGRQAPGRRGRRRTGKKALNIGGNIRASARHPGTRGKHIFRDAKKRIIDGTPRTVFHAVVNDIGKQLG